MVIACNELISGNLNRSKPEFIEKFGGFSWKSNPFCNIICHFFRFACPARAGNKNLFHKISSLPYQFAELAVPCTIIAVTYRGLSEFRSPGLIFLRCKNSLTTLQIKLADFVFIIWIFHVEMLAATYGTCHHTPLLSAGFYFFLWFSFWHVLQNPLRTTLLFATRNCFRMPWGMVRLS